MSCEPVVYIAGSVMSFSDDIALIMLFALIMLSIQILLMLDALPVVRLLLRRMRGEFIF